MHFRPTPCVIGKDGKPLYELVSPEGHVFLMHSSNVEVKELATLGKRLKLPEGWQYRVRTLDEDFTLRLEGITHVVSDDLRNVYNRISK